MPCWSHRSEMGERSRRWSRKMATISGAEKRVRVILGMGGPPLEFVAYSSRPFVPFQLRQNTRKRGGSTHLSHTRRECLPLHEEPAVRASHFSSPRAPGGIAYLSVRLGVPLVGYHRDDVGATRDPHVMDDRARPAGDSRDRDDCSPDRPERNGVLRIRRSATPEPDHRVLYEALGVPMEIIRPVKTWGRTELNSD